jgi:hypothetical protein
MTDKNESLKAAEPGSHPKAEKYGMPIEHAPRIVERHFGIVDEEAALAGAQIAHDIKISKALRVAADRQVQADTPPPAPAAQPLAEALGEAQDWRAKLGLG